MLIFNKNVIVSSLNTIWGMLTFCQSCFGRNLFKRRNVYGPICSVRYWELVLLSSDKIWLLLEIHYQLSFKVIRTYISYLNGQWLRGRSRHLKYSYRGLTLSVLKQSYSRASTRNKLVSKHTKRRLHDNRNFHTVVQSITNTTKVTNVICSSRFDLICCVW